MTTGKYVTPIGYFFSAAMVCLKFRCKSNWGTMRRKIIFIE